LTHNNVMSAVGSNNRYDRDRPVTGQEMDESRALHTLGEVVSKQIPLLLQRSSVLELAEVLHATAIELGNGRPVPLGVRRAVLRLATACANRWTRAPAGAALAG
jgi:hypothetical protein